MIANGWYPNGYFSKGWWADGWWPAYTGLILPYYGEIVVLKSMISMLIQMNSGITREITEDSAIG